MKITEDIHIIQCPLNEIFTGVYAILGDGITLLDSGLPASPEGAIFPYLSSVGRDPSEISLVIISHGHDDHCGGVASIKRVSGARIASHALDAIYVQNPGKLRLDLHDRFPRYYPRPSNEEISQLRNIGSMVDMLLEDGMHIDLGPFEVEVVHTPGHTDGSICLYDRKRKMLFTGDSVQGTGTVLQSGPLIYGDLDAYVRSMERLRSLKPEMMLLDHQYLPLDSAILRGTEVMDMLEESIACIEEIRKLVLHRVVSRTFTEMDQLVGEVRAAYATLNTSMPPCSVVDATLRSLERQSLIKRSGSDGWKRAEQ